jgi:hypothetical protein
VGIKLTTRQKADKPKPRRPEMMVRTSSLFSQLLSLISRHDFARHVRDLKTERHSKGFGCWDQLVAMLFCQLAQAKSLREIQQGLSSCLGKLQHLGLSKAPGRSTLSYANAHRDARLFERVFYDVLGRCQAIAPRKPFRFKSKLLSLDATVIDLCASVFDWATFRRSKGAVKLHLLLDHDGYLPTFACITEGSVHEVKMAQKMDFPKGSVVVVDRGYCDYELFGQWTQQGVWFVSRLKRNADYYVRKRRKVPPKSSIIADEVIELAGYYSHKKCPHLLRRVVIWDEEQGEIELISNQMDYAATTIARIYKDRWQIELFFKALKQNLKIKTFVGTSANALRIQIWTALIAILMIKYLQFKSRMNWSLSNLVALLRLNLFTYRDLWSWIDNPYNTPPGSWGYEQPDLPDMNLDSIR